MTLLLLKTGDPSPGAGATYEELFGQWLGPIEVADPRHADFPSGSWAGVVVTGSACSTYQRLPWIAATEDFLHRQADQGVPIYGVCFGHQLLAQAFGGKVERCPHGWELGTTSVALTPEGVLDPLFQGFPPSFTVQQSHGDVVTEMPAGTVVLASNPHWPVQAFRLGDKIWGTQFHPEFTRQTVTASIGRVAPLVGEKGFPHRPSGRPLQQWLLDGLEDTPQAPQCLANFAAIVRQLSGASGDRLVK